MRRARGFRSKSGRTPAETRHPPTPSAYLTGVLPDAPTPHRLSCCNALELCPKHTLLPRQIHFIMALKRTEVPFGFIGMLRGQEGICAGRCPAGAGDIPSLLVSPTGTGTCTPRAVCMPWSKAPAEIFTLFPRLFAIHFPQNCPSCKLFLGNKFPPEP